jgi:3-oxoacyl-[acyl-carrier-protein] synthase II
MKPVVVAAEMITALGPDADSTWNALLAGSIALAVSDRVRVPIGSTPAPVGLVPGIGPERPAVIQMIEPLLDRLRPTLPPSPFVLLATTAGEIEQMEAAVLDGTGTGEASDPSRLLERVCALCGPGCSGLVFSAACASSTVALARAASLIRSGARGSVLVVACDAVSEFVYAGFATLNALDPAGARPFDKNRQGLSLGEAAAAMLLMGETRTRGEGRPILGEIAGWSLTNDATHVTRPDPAGTQLARASLQAIASAGIEPDRIGFISAHGTGTQHNDAMEIAAFRSVLPPRPLFSVKGSIGHTLGAAGLVEAIVTLRALGEGLVPPTPGLSDPDADAVGWASPEPVRLDGTRAALTTNSGFGGINAALVLAPPDPGRTASRAPIAKKPAPRGPVATGVGWVTASAYGRVRQGDSGELADGVKLLRSVNALFQHKIENFGRFDPVSRMACCACALALRDAGLDYSPERKQELGIVGVGFTGSIGANRLFFKDYVDAGRTLARGNLFVYTLPSAPPGEAAIHFGFQGPLFSVVAPATPLADGLEIAAALVADGDAPALLVVHAESDLAVAVLVGPASDECPLFSRVKAVASRHPKLRESIADLSVNPIRETTPCA